MIGVERKYQFCPSLISLKGVNFPVISVGQKESGIEYEVLTYKDEGGGVLENIFINDSYVDCYQAIGISNKAGLLCNLIKSKKKY